MSHQLSYPEPVRQVLAQSARVTELDGELELAPVSGTPVWNVHGSGGALVDCVVLAGPDGLILVGTGASIEQGHTLAATLTSHFDRPVRAVVYGQRRQSHYSGTRAVLSHHHDDIPVIALDGWHHRGRASPPQALTSLFAVREAMQYGTALRDLATRDSLVHRLLSGPRSTDPPVAPTVTVTHNQEMDLAGLRVRFFTTGAMRGAPLGLYLPRHRIAVVAEDLLASPSNLNAIEGAPAVVSRGWQTLLTHLSTLDVEDLVGTRTHPLRGGENVRGLLDTYQDAIDYLHDQAVRQMLAGRSPEEAMHRISLAPDVLTGPFPRPVYGNFLGSAVYYYTEYLGWFFGHAVDLAPTPREERARRTVALMGGQERVLDASVGALDDGDPQWAAELARLAVSAAPENTSGRTALARALWALGDREPNPLRRNWYHSAALDTTGELRLAEIRDAVERPTALSAHALLDGLRFRVAPDAAANRRVSISVEISDTGERFGLQLRNSVLRVRAGTPTEWNAGMRLSRAVLARLVLGEASVRELIDRHEIEVQGLSGPVGELWDAIEERPELSFHRV